MKHWPLVGDWWITLVAAFYHLSTWWGFKISMIILIQVDLKFWSKYLVLVNYSCVLFSCSVSGLSAGVRYNVSVYAVTSRGVSAPSSRLVYSREQSKYLRLSMALLTHTLLDLEHFSTTEWLTDSTWCKAHTKHYGVLTHHPLFFFFFYKNQHLVPLCQCWSTNTGRSWSGGMSCL